MMMAMMMAMMMMMMVIVAIVVLNVGKVHSQHANRTNPRVGTGGGGWGIAHNLPGVQYPFAAMRLGPDTALNNVWIRWNHHGGYFDRDTHIRCFSHNRYVGGGGSDMGLFGVMALDKPITDALITNYGYRSEFIADDHVLYPGYYSIPLLTHNVFAELTVAGNFTGLHRYTYSNPQATRSIIVDICHSLNDNDAACAIASANLDIPANRYTASILLRGSGTGKGSNGGVWFYYCAQFSEGSESEEIIGYGTWKDNVVYRNTTTMSKIEGESPSLGMFFEFAPSSSLQPINIQGGISLLSINQACANLEYDLRNRGFDQALVDVANVWEEQLSILDVELREDQSEDDAVSLFTAVYRSLMSPTIYTETNGEFLGFDKLVRSYPHGQSRFSDMSLWDTFRTQHPWLILFRPDVALNCVQSLIDMSIEGTDLPRWPLASHETGSMLGDSCNSVIVDYLFKVGPQGLNLTVAYEKMKIKSLEQRPSSGRSNVQDYNQYGYIPVESCQRCSSHDLHYYYDDYTISLLAGYLGYTADAEFFYQRSLNYSLHFDQETLFMQPKRLDGSFVIVPPENQVISNEFWVEGNTNHWTFFVQHDPEGLINLYPSPEVFVDRLNDIFVAYVNSGTLQSENILPNVGYWGGNEPCLFHAYLFAYAGRPDLTQYWVRYLMTDLYTNTPGGVPGNDDFGTLSAWYSFSALGFYPNPPHSYYVIGSPLFASATVRFPNGRSLTVIAHNNSATNVYVQQVNLNGAPLASFPFIEHADVIMGGILEFFMIPTSEFA